MAEFIAQHGAEQGPSPQAASRCAVSTEVGPSLRVSTRSLAGATARELTLLLLGLLALLALEMAVVPPRGEFPVMDDWAFYRIAKVWAETGRFAYVGSNEMILLTQAALGALVIKLFGFSFLGPRLLVLGLGVLSLAAPYGCGREMGLAPRAAGSGISPASTRACGMTT